MEYRDHEEEEDEVDGEIDTSRPGMRRSRSRSPSPPPRQPPPPAYHQPDWARDDGPSCEHDPIPLDPDAEGLDDDQHQRDEEDEGRWAHRTASDEPPTLEAMDSSDDDYDDSDKTGRRSMLRRRRMQRYRSMDPHTRTPNTSIDKLLQHPDVALQPRFNDLELNAEMEKLMRDYPYSDPWTTYWRFNDRNWCFFCWYRRNTLDTVVDPEFQIMNEMLTRPLMDHSEEYVVQMLQNMFFITFQPRLPPRKPCKRTGRPRPPHYLWKCSIRRHKHEHMHRPIHDKIKMRTKLRRANELLGSMVFKRHRSTHDVEFDGARMKHFRENADLIMRIDDRIAKEVAQFRA